MEVIFAPKALEDLKYWKKSGNKIIQKKIQELILAIQKNPFEGIGKPEQLKHNLCWIMVSQNKIKNIVWCMKSMKEMRL